MELKPNGTAGSQLDQIHRLNPCALSTLGDMGNVNSV